MTAPREETLHYLRRWRQDLDGLIDLVETGILEGAYNEKGYIYLRKAVGGVV